MGILNITPDSFSDGGELYRNGGPDLERILRRAAQMVAEGAEILDIGGESTRPGSEPVTAAEECDRVLPAVERISAELPVIISVDSSNPQLMRLAAAAGAGMINDVRALRRPGAPEAVAATELPVCLMHMRGEPQTMQSDLHYRDVVTEVRDFLLQRVAACEAAGIARNRLILDPGFGFGKGDADNLTLIRQLHVFTATGLPILVGVSRKSTIGRLLGRELPDRLPGSLALSLEAARNGARLLRTHDVQATADALQLAWRLWQE